MPSPGSMKTLIILTQFGPGGKQRPHRRGLARPRGAAWGWCFVGMVMWALLGGEPRRVIAASRDAPSPEGAESLIAVWDLTVDWAYGTFPLELHLFPDWAIQIVREGRSEFGTARVENGRLRFPLGYVHEGSRHELYFDLGLKDGRLAGSASSEIGTAMVAGGRRPADLTGVWRLEGALEEPRFAGRWDVKPDGSGRLTTEYETVEHGSTRLKGNRFEMSVPVATPGGEARFAFYGFVVGDRIDARVAGAEGPYWNLVPVRGTRLEGESQPAAGAR